MVVLASSVVGVCVDDVAVFVAAVKVLDGDVD